MTIDTKELRRVAQEAMHPVTKGRWIRLFGERTVYDRMEDGCRGIPVVSTHFSPPHPFEAACLDFIAAANPAAISELLDRLEAAEKERDDLRAENAALVDDMNLLRDNNTALRAKVDAMERQEPVLWARKLAIGLPSFGCVTDLKYRPSNMPESAYMPLYALPGAQPAPNAVAYLDLGAGGYMDIGTDLTDEALAAIPKGRHMLGIVGTYGVEGYSPAQPAPSVPREAIEKMLTQLMDIAVSNGANSISMPDEYVEVAAWLCGIPAQPTPSVPDGWKLVPIEPTQKMIDHIIDERLDALVAGKDHTFIDIYKAMLAAAPEAKP